MQRTSPAYAFAQDLTLKQYYKVFFENDRFMYPSIWSWWKKTTLFFSVPLGIACLPLFIAILYQELSMPTKTDWILVISCSLLPFMIFYPIILAIAFYRSIIVPDRINKRIAEFIATYIPDAVDVESYGVTNYTFKWRGLEFELTYNALQGVFFSLNLYYVPETEFKFHDENGELCDKFYEFEDRWYEYRDSTCSCKNLYVNRIAMYTVFKLKEISNPNEVTDALCQLQNLLNRLHCIPLPPFPAFRKDIISWLRSVDRAAPADITAIYIGIFESGNSSYTLHISGAQHYGENDEDWACAEDFVPEQKYTVLHTHIEAIDWESIQQTVVDTVSQYLKTRAQDTTSLFYGKIVAVGFDDGNLIRIQ